MVAGGREEGVESGGESLQIGGNSMAKSFCQQDMDGKTSNLDSTSGILGY